MRKDTEIQSSCKPLLLELLKEDIAGWAQFLLLERRTIDKIIDGSRTLHIKTARSILERINMQTGEHWKLERLFHLSKLKGYDHDREVVHAFQSRPLSQIEKASIIEYLLEKKFRGLTIFDILLFMLLVGVVGIFVVYFVERFQF